MTARTARAPRTAAVVAPRNVARKPAAKKVGSRSNGTPKPHTIVTPPAPVAGPAIVANPPVRPIDFAKVPAGPDTIVTRRPTPGKLLHLHLVGPETWSAYMGLDHWTIRKVARGKWVSTVEGEELAVQARTFRESIAKLRALVRYNPEAV